MIHVDYHYTMFYFVMKQTFRALGANAPVEIAVSSHLGSTTHINYYSHISPNNTRHSCKQLNR